MDAPSDSRRPIGRSDPIGAKRSRSAARGTRERRHTLIISCSILLVATLIAVVVVANVSPKSVNATISPPAAAAMPENELRTAKFTTNSDASGCSQQIFDNQSGRVLRSQKPCEATAYDTNGAPVPVATIHRLEAISKSFTGH
jgi:hypothetical protein